MPLTGAPPTLLMTADHTCIRDLIGILPLALSVLDCQAETAHSAGHRFRHLDGLEVSAGTGP